MCTYFKFLLRRESARDYVDALLTMKKRPKVLISDIASQVREYSILLAKFTHVFLRKVAHHGERRCGGLFHPNKGMLFAYDDDCIEKYQKKQLRPVKIDLDIDDGKFYSLNDRFHQYSKKKTIESAFRDAKYCIDLNLINTSVAEQENAVMARDR